jgi:hypothetical protein
MLISHEHIRAVNGDATMQTIDVNDFDFSLYDLPELLIILRDTKAGVGVTEIGRRIDKSQSFVSRVFERLEKFLKSPARNGKSLTEQGSAVLETVERLVELLHESLGATRFGATHLRIGSIPSVLASFMPRVIARLSSQGYFQQNPHVAIHLESDSAERLFEKLDRGLLDLVIASPNRNSILTYEDKKATGLREWRLVKNNASLLSKDVHYLELFRARPVGLIYHQSNKIMCEMARNPLSFSFERFRSLMVFLTSDPTQPAFETEFEKALPAPRARVGTRIWFQTFSQIRAALRQDDARIKARAVGVGVRLPGDSNKNLCFLSFRTLQKEVKTLAPGPADYPIIRHLAKMSIQSFYAYGKLTKFRTTIRGGVFRGLYEALEFAANNYRHPYIA